MSSTQKRQKVVKSHPKLSLNKQCKLLLEINRSGLYYKTKGESLLSLTLMKEINKHLAPPCYGVERMTDYLKLDLGYNVNIKRIRRLYRLMRLQTIYMKSKTTIRDETSIYTLIY